jgi:ABC-type antimicrobial peptide transport system permease subunit
VIGRAAGDARAIIPSIRAAAAGADPDVPVGRVVPLENLVTNSLSGARFNLLLIAAFAIVAMLMAGVGIYGSMSRAVRERTREFGVRLALGAPRGAIVSAALSQAVRVIVGGAVAGLLGIFVLSRVLGNALFLVPHEHGGLLYGVRLTDPLAIGAGLILVITVAVTASLVPARHATRVDPLVVLRTD